MLLPLMVESRMSHYFFDLDDGQRFFRDEVGIECGDLHAVRAEVARTLTAVTRDNIAVAPLSNAKDADHQTLMIFVRNTSGRAIYTATMAFTGLWHDEGMPTVTELFNRDGYPPLIWGYDY